MWDVVPQPGIEPMPPALGTRSLNHLDYQGSPYFHDFLNLLFYIGGYHNIVIVSDGQRRDMDLWQPVENTLFPVNSEKQSVSTLVGGEQAGMGGG